MHCEIIQTQWTNCVEFRNNINVTPRRRATPVNVAIEFLYNTPINSLWISDADCWPKPKSTMDL